MNTSELVITSYSIHYTKLYDDLLKRRKQIIGVIREAEVVQALAAAAAAVRAQRQREGGMTLRGKPWQPVLGPAPRADIGTMQEEQRHSPAVRPAGKQLQRDRTLDDAALDFDAAQDGTRIPRCTAGRALIVSNQRFTLGYSYNFV